MSEEAPPPDTPFRTVLGSVGREVWPAETGDLVQTPAFALRYGGRKRVDTAGEAMARITAERLVEHLRASGYVVMHKVPVPPGPNLVYEPSARKAMCR